MAFPDLDDLPGPVRDLLDVTVGLGLLSFQRAQVQRRAFEKQIESIEPELPDPARSVARNVRVVSETVGEGLARLLVPGTGSSSNSVHRESVSLKPDPDHSPEPEHSQKNPATGARSGESTMDNHLDGRSTSRLDDDQPHRDQAEADPDPTPDETHEA